MFLFVRVRVCARVRVRVRARVSEAKGWGGGGGGVEAGNECLSRGKHLVLLSETNIKLFFHFKEVLPSFNRDRYR